VINQFMGNIKSLFYDNYGIVAIIVMLFFIIAIIAIYFNGCLTAFAKDTIPLTGYITIYCATMILLNASSLTYALHLRYIIPIFPFAVLFIFSPFCVRYNKSLYHNADRVLPIILGVLLVIQGATALYSYSTEVREQSLMYSFDRERLSEYISENNLTKSSIIYQDSSIDWSKFEMELRMRYSGKMPKYQIIRHQFPGESILDNTSGDNLAELIKTNKDLKAYVIVAKDVADIYMKNPSYEFCLYDPYEFSDSVLFKVSIPENNESCDLNLAQRQE
jgi:hypothetical protein